MKNKDEIIQELKALNSSLAFEEVAHRVFQTPAHYFQRFPEQMSEIVRDMQLDTNLDIDNKLNSYSIPNQYFEKLSDDILAKVKAADQIIEHDRTEIPAFLKQHQYDVPEGYFEQFPEHTLSLINNNTEDNIELSPLLASLKQEQPFMVPDGYFNVKEIIQKAKGKETEQPKVMPHPAVRSITWARWAAAAAILAIFSLGGIQFLNQPAKLSPQASFDQALAQIPDAKIQEWLSNNLDEADINSLGGSVANLNTTKISSDILKNVPDATIEDYEESEGL